MADVGSPAGGADDPLWDDWEAPPRLPASPVLHLEGFDGPMDVLLDLAERQRIDFGRMSIWNSPSSSSRPWRGSPIG